MTGEPSPSTISVPFTRKKLVVILFGCLEGRRDEYTQILQKPNQQLQIKI